MTALDASPNCPFSFTAYGPVPVPIPATAAGQPNRPQLRSCLSPSRSPSMTPSLHSEAYPTPSGSRSTSFSSCGSGEGWKRTKCVRWQEMNGCAVTSTHDTYSHEEYDRTPLEPPSQAERACVLPERGSRSLSAARDCFLSDIYDDVDDDDEPTSLEDSSDSYYLRTPPPTETCSEAGDEDEEEHEHEHARENGEEVGEQDADREWEACMERRRMMFARMCPQANGGDGERHPEFEGYRSISATLAQLLKSVNCDGGEAESPIAEEEEEEGEQGEDQVDRGDCGFGFTSLKYGGFGITVDRGENDEPDTPSLVSSTEAESETECVIASPGGTCSTVVPTIMGSTAEDVVLAAWGKDRGRGRSRERTRDDLRLF